MAENDVRRICQGGLDAGATRVTLLSPDGQVRLQVGAEAASNGRKTLGAANPTEVSAPVLVRGQIVATVISTIPSSAAPRARWSTDLVAAQLSVAWIGALEAQLRAVLDNLTDGVMTIDDENIVTSLNPGAERIFGFSATEAIGRDLRMLVPDLSIAAMGGNGSAIPVAAPALADTRSTWRAATGRRKNGVTFPLDLGISEVQLAARRVFVVSARDVTERNHLEDLLRHQATRDPLTELPNRSWLVERVKQVIGAANRRQGGFCVLVIDLDRFKEINDRFGHECGDRILREVVSRLHGVLRESEALARLGGDEFALLLPDADAEEATRVARRLIGALEPRFVDRGHSFTVGGSIGISSYPEDGRDAGSLLRCADVAMFVAKRSRSGYASYSVGQDDESSVRFQLIRELREAIDQDRLTLYYQPMADLRTGRFVRVAALVHWRHPANDLVLPAQFIPQAEQSGLTGPLSHWVLNAALRQCREWIDAGYDIGVAVNLSGENVCDALLPRDIAELIERWRVPPRLLQVEISERSLRSDSSAVSRVLGDLRAMGLRIAVDDCGSGFSSLAYLKQLPVDEIKIDRCFMLHLVKDDNDAAIVRSTIRQGHDLGLKVVAVGVEDEATWTYLANLGCDVAQGNYLSPPVPSIELIQWLCRASAP